MSKIKYKADLNNREVNDKCPTQDNEVVIGDGLVAPITLQLQIRKTNALAKAS